ncbi:phage baseplate assembly protein V [Flavobacterium sp. DG1-102-2]|uniref:type VI secretion system Vgr family protein n=1 Tax=Flavobacterium sp. DG1-102-2 TaxID=3081663 RepID=UPI002949E3DE|nr:phage baseplate assembly protein V [Flavobacterium sp. DG1-102-2]MDV6167379.1 phage baseplate assembly protein V [Flavobacterium sp. DG1-102-2]
MPITTQINIQIGGETLTRFSKLIINQKVHTHHRFSILQPLPKEFVSEAIDKAQGYIGQPVKISITPTSMTTSSPLLFNGVITEAQLVRTAGASGGIVINGYSPTILMEGTPNTKSFTDKSLGDIVKEVTGTYSKESIKSTVNIQKDTVLPYTVQYGESDFAFICRLAQKKGQWFYYNGEDLIFGEPKPKNFTLEYGRSLHSFNIEMRAKSLGFEYVGYDPANGETQKANTGEVNYEPNGYSKSMYEACKKMFPNTSTILYTHSLEENNSKTHLTERITTQLQSRAADLVTAKGDSDETGLKIGDVVTINEPAFSLTGNLLDGLKEQTFGNYILTDIMHVCDESGTYHNTFDAVPESAVIPPYGNVHSFPVADSQPATVISNQDPAGLGRIKVAFAWQKTDGKNTPWIRMINPHSGSGKGFYFIPEEGEEVLVGFEGGNAEKPFVLGAMYNGAATSNYHTVGNDQKAIHTRSGTKIVFNDSAGSVFIEDPSGNTWLMDGQGNISVNAPKNFSITAGDNVNIRAGKNVSVSAAVNMDSSAGDTITVVAGKDIMQTATGDIIETSDNRMETVDKDFFRQADNSSEMASEAKMFSEKENMTMQSGKTVEFNSAEKSKLF